MDPYPECGKCPARMSCKIRAGKVSPKASYLGCGPHKILTQAIKLSQLPPRYLDFSRDTSWLKGEDLMHYRTVLKSVNNMVLNAGNIAILGDTGRGKTFIACRALLEFIKANCLKRDMFDFDSPLGLYVNYPDLLAYARDGVIDTDAMEIYYNVPLLLLDDVGADRGTKFASDILYLIINNRLSNCRSTLYTSNLSSNNMADVLGKRIASRIIGESKAISLVGSEDTRHV